MREAEPASGDEYRLGTAIRASARQNAADKVRRDLMTTVLLKHTNGPHNNRLSILLSASTTNYPLIQYSDMKEVQCLVNDVVRQSTTFENIHDGRPISFSCCPNLHTSHHFRHLPVSCASRRRKTLNNSMSKDCGF